ncbi:glycosyltransferase [Candidatus Woesearchaeota archaeon]|nr:glycosyltransferase [Candidatus Woesearchaeota archaeon]
MKLSIVLPAYNEEEILGKNVQSLYNEVRKFIGTGSFEIIVCDDTSTDATPKICQQLSKHFREVRCIRYENGPSRRENLSLAIKAAQGDIIICTDTDLSVKPAFIAKLISGIGQGYDIVTGSRYTKGACVKRTLFRSMISRAYNLFMRTYFGSKIRDHQCGFKAFRRKAIFQLTDELGYDSSFRRGWFWDTELLIRAQRHRFRVLEIPVDWEGDAKSSFKISREIRMIPYVLSLKWRLRGRMKNA